ncbi:MAG TPA: hypothetical protein VK858_06180 [Longimicrobiales bacterium]|nr:hypothetical protein [Longimicrobiales bacterium]
MGRWGHARARGWMRPRSLPPRRHVSGEGGGVGLQAAPEVESSWARGPRPLRRREGIPPDLETPGFLHREELQRARSGHRWVVTTLLAMIAAASMVALSIRGILG